MAPTQIAEMASLVKRYCYEYDRYGRCIRSSSWGWARWVVAAIIIVGFLFVLAIIMCISARRRRRRGNAPMYGTGWMANPNKFGPGPGYGPNNNYNQPPPPQYQPPNQYDPNQGYYGGQQEGINLQQPQNVYARGGDDYAPPQGPPPGKAGH